ncbi:MAG: hypothetical protein HRT90_11105 [Candidatus Margulisbacteria bacterium]|nr:hypothetical protein [Candidatus Margulisiibacteriota bacterium]
MIVKDQQKRREILIRQENKLLGELPVQEVQLVVSFTQKRKEDYFLTQQKMKEHQDKLDSLPIMIPTEEGLTAIKEAREDERNGRLTKAVDPRNRKALREVLRSAQ